MGRRHFSLYSRKLIKSDAFLGIVSLVKQQHWLIGSCDTMIDHGSVVGKISELGIIALHPVELSLEFVQTHCHIVLSIIQDDA